jgi:hypothetical protein
MAATHYTHQAVCTLGMRSLSPHSEGFRHRTSLHVCKEMWQCHCSSLPVEIVYSKLTDPDRCWTIVSARACDVKAGSHDGVILRGPAGGPSFEIRKCQEIASYSPTRLSDALRCQCNWSQRSVIVAHMPHPQRNGTSDTITS